MSNFYKSYISTAQGKEFRITNSRLGAPTHPGVAKQLEEFGKLLNQGMKNIEVGTIDPDKFEFIPRQHFDEIRRLAKITDSHASVHAPLIDLAGFPDRQGGKWSEDQRKGTEERLYAILQRSFNLSNGENVPVVFHAGHFDSQEFQKDIAVTQFDENGEPLRDKEGNMITKKQPLGYRKIVAVNQDSGEITQMEYEEKQMLGRKDKEIWDPMRRLYNTNQTYWDDEKLKLLQRQKEIQELKDRMDIKVQQNEAIEKGNLINDPKYQEVYSVNNRDIRLLTGHIEDIHQKLTSEYHDIYDRFTRFAKPEVKEEYQEKLNEMNAEYTQKNKELKDIYKEINEKNKQIRQLAEQKAKEDFGKSYEELNREEELRIQRELSPYFKETEHKTREALNLQLEQSKNILINVAPMPAPQLWRWVGEFAIDKTAETVSNAMARMYINYKKEGKQDQIPFVAMENFFVNTPMSTAKELKIAVEKSRELFAQKLFRENAVSNLDEGKKAAEKMIGATWDVGHINNLRKAGLEGEELKKRVIEETKEIADVTKHVHITDNFGFHDTHLPPGMGNVPIREIMEELEKKWSEMRDQQKLGQEPRAIVEAGGFVGEIGQNPTLATLEYFGSPLYKISNSPYFWGPEERSIGHSYTRYMESFIDFPQQHFNLYGSSFTALPKSVGGQVGEGASRFTGTPNQ